MCFSADTFEQVDHLHGHQSGDENKDRVRRKVVKAARGRQLLSESFDQEYLNRKALK